MKDLKEKLSVMLKDPEAAKELLKFGLTAEIVEGIEDLKKPATLNEAITAFNLQSELDKVITKATQTREDNLKAKYNFVDKEQPKPEDPKGPTPPENPELAALQAQLKAITDTLAQNQAKEKENALLASRAKAVELLASKGIPAVYAGNLDLSKDINEQLPEVEKAFQTDLTTFKISKLPNTKLPLGTPPDPNQLSKEEQEAFKQNF
jgi:hypothetical protein